MNAVSCTHIFNVSKYDNFIILYMCLYYTWYIIWACNS